MKKIAVFASGSGTNAQTIIEHFSDSKLAVVDCILTNNPKAHVLNRAYNLNIKSFTFNREDFYSSENIITILIKRKIDFVVLAGFLWLVPEYLINAYSKRIVNIHPALLPKYGGKGMYGMLVHESVLENKEKESGITIHYVNSKYDEGDVIFQAKCSVAPDETPESLAQKVHKLEYKHYPEVIELLISQLT